MESVWTVACVEEKTPAKVANKFAVLVDEDAELQKTKKVKMEVAIDSGAESVWPISLLNENLTTKIVGKCKRFLAANGQEMGHYGRREVKFGDAGDAKMLSFGVTDVTKPPGAVRRMIEKENGAGRRTFSGMRNRARFQRGRRARPS